MNSQYHQDALVLHLLGGMRNGFFLDSGASDGVTFSNTFVLEAAYGWAGICVEPNETFFASLVRNRRCHCVNCCLYDHDGYVEFVEQAEMFGGILDDLDEMHRQYAHAALQVPVDVHGRLATVRRSARTVESVLREFGAPPVIDYWSLDTEGSELSIIKSFPFDRYSFRVLTVEHNHGPNREPIREMLEPRGYARIEVLDVDDCYVRVPL
jgi:FkbM family methyltransferase